MVEAGLPGETDERPPVRGRADTAREYRHVPVEAAEREVTGVHLRPRRVVVVGHLGWQLDHLRNDSENDAHGSLTQLNCSCIIYT